MSFDTTTWAIIGGAAVLLILLLFLLLRGRRQSVIARPEHDKEKPYVATTDRAYVSADATNKRDGDLGLSATPPPPEMVAAPPPVVAAPPTQTPLRDAPLPDVPLPIAGEIAGIAMPPHATDAPDTLTKLKGVGPKLAAQLHDLGYSRFDQLGALDDAALDALDAQLGTFAGRLRRDRVVEQARLLASGDVAGFEAAFGKLGS